MTVIEVGRTNGKEHKNEGTRVRITAENEANDEDTEIGGMIEKYKGMRKKKNAEIMKTEDDKDQDAIMKLDGEFRALYNEIMNRPTMVEFSDAKADADKVLAFVMKIINGSVNGENPDEIEEDDENAGCGGSCSSCKGCH